MNGVTTTFTMDLNTGLTQALSDGTHTYTYGLGRIAQYDTTAEYFLGDALGSVRQLTDAQGRITLAKAYNPYGEVTQSAGAGQSSYGYTNEYQDGYNDLMYLRARHYAPSMGRFLSRDTWAGDVNRPGSLNRWGYVEGNPTNLIDPTGMHPGEDHFKYCEYLNGDDYKYCNRIVRRFDPTDDSVTIIQWIKYDLGICDNAAPLEELLTHYVHDGTWKQYGWWWHYLLDRTPGWWNSNGTEHLYFKDVIAIALGVELGRAAITYEELPKYAAGAFASKGSAEGLFFVK